MLELWFDFSCPYAYLASRRAHTLGVAIDWRPMLLGGVFRGIGAGDGPMATLSPIKAAHNHADMHRWAEVFDEPFQLPAAHPMRTVRALRTLLALPHDTWAAAIAALFAAYWQRGEDITRDEVIAAALRGGGVGETAITAALARADDDAIKADLRRRTDEAIGLGIFGAPAFVLRDRGILVWGQDRFPWLEAILGGWNPDEVGPPPGGPRPLAPTQRAAPGATLDVYVDVSSPFAYLALTQLPALAAMGVDRHSASPFGDAAHLGEAEAFVPRLVPILLGGLFRDIGQVDVPLLAFTPPKMRYISNDMQRWARWWGVPFEMPKKFPQRTITAQRLIVLATDQGFPVACRLATALGRAMWAEQRDLEDDATLRAIVEANGLSPALVDQTREPEVKARLIANTSAAATAQVFGVPTYVVNNQCRIWGQDRLDFVVRALAGWSPRF